MARSQPTMEKPSSTEVVHFGPFTANLRTRELKKSGVRVKLIGQPFEILTLLLQRPGELITREELRSHLWPGDTFVDFDHGLNAAVNKLREALGDSAEEPRYIETLPRRGYRLIADVGNANTRVASDAAEKEAPGELLYGTAQLPQAGGAPAKPVAGRKALLAWALALAAVLLVGTFVARMYATHNAAPIAPVRLSVASGIAENAGQPALSGDGKRLAYLRASPGGNDVALVIKDSGGEQQQELAHGGDLCCAAWSPDGGTISFARNMGGVIRFYAVATGNGTGTRAEREVATGGIRPVAGYMEWSLDGRSLLFTSSSGIFAAELAGGPPRRVTQSPPNAQDWGPSLSPDGNTLLFVRRRDGGFPEEILSVPARGGDPTLIAAEAAPIIGPPQWTADGRGVIFASARGGKSGLWRVSAQTREPATQVMDNGAYPAVARTADRLAYERESHDLTIWQMDVSEPDGTNRRSDRPLISLTSQTDQGPGPQFSPDGKQLAFMSDRSGAMEIWVSDRDGQNARQLTTVGNAGTPRWSPDGRSIVFDAYAHGSAQIYVAEIAGGPARLLTDDHSENRCPSWSNDGRWIYFASTRGHGWQIWKAPAGGGAAVQVTQQGGHAAFESLDGKTLYFAKTPYANPEIWQVPVNGGRESPVSPLLRPVSWAAWSVVRGGIVYAAPSGTGAPVVNFFDLESRRVKTVGHLDTVPFWLSATRDGKTLVFDKQGWRQSQIMLLENYR